MADESGDILPGSGDNALAAQIAMNEKGGHSAEAREYLRKQSRIADLQIDTLQKKDEFELSHLRFRRFSDYAKFTLEISIALIVLLILTGLGTMVWDASRDHDLVVDAFTVPPDIAQTGMTGTALANRVLDRFGAMDGDVRSFQQDFSGYHRDASDEVRVEIPDTGISIGELNRYLRAGLGAETHVAGELVRTAKGLALTVRYGSNPGSTVEGSDLNLLIGKAAERIFRAGQPLRYADYLSSHNRIAEGRAVADAETRTGNSKHRSQAYTSLGTNDYWSGDNDALARDGGAATRLDPGNAIGWFMLWAYANNKDHTEADLQVSKKILDLVKSGQVSTTGDLALSMPVELRATIQSLQGDFAAQIATCKALTVHAHSGCADGFLAGSAAADHDIDKANAFIAEAPRMRTNGKPDQERFFTLAQIALPAGDYAGGLAAAKQGEAIVGHDPTQKLDRDVFLRPFEAEILARMGKIAEANALIATTALDCDTCVRARGRIAMLARDWKGAEHWFAMVSGRAPDIPFAETDWGEMLLRKGDRNGAIAKFESANKKAPHFADPLEMWGEALIAENRSDLAVAKFADAAKYAPNWGRLHLKWGEALLWSGDHAAAQTQFATAAKLDLTPSEKAGLARVMHG